MNDPDLGTLITNLESIVSKMRFYYKIVEVAEQGHISSKNVENALERILSTATCLGDYENGFLRIIPAMKEQLKPLKPVNMWME